eukprot:scaffold736_cov254-Pinguiococcus_pyrenoidosus.AAC.21
MTHRKTRGRPAGGRGSLGTSLKIRSIPLGSTNSLMLWTQGTATTFEMDEKATTYVCVTRFSFSRSGLARRGELLASSGSGANASPIAPLPMSRNASSQDISCSVLSSLWA